MNSVSYFVFVTVFRRAIDECVLIFVYNFWYTSWHEPAINFENGYRVCKPMNIVANFFFLDKLSQVTPR